MVSEYPLTVMVNGQEFVTLVCTPDHLEELVIGFLASEGVIRFEKEIKSFTIDESLGFAYVELTNPGVLEQKDYTKRVIGSCCGKGRHFYFQQDVKTAKVSHSAALWTPPVSRKVPLPLCISFIRRRHVSGVMVIRLTAVLAVFTSC